MGRNFDAVAFTHGGKVKLKALPSNHNFPLIPNNPLITVE